VQGDRHRQGVREQRPGCDRETERVLPVAASAIDPR